MFKRTRGYLLLTMLVLTGLAGRMHTDILSGKERRLLINEIKSARTALIRSTDGLSKKQLNFKPGKGKTNIRQLIYQLASIENGLRDMSRNLVHQEAPHQKPATVRDGDLDSIASEIGRDPKQLLIQIAAFKSADAALDSFKTSSTDLLKYARTTTENVRGHILVTAAGNFDAYQMMRLTSLCTVYFIEEIESIKKAHNFPK